MSRANIEKVHHIHADLCKIFTSPVRLKILGLLRDSERSVNELTEMIGLNQPNISQHLSTMREKGIVSTRKEGTTIYYRVYNNKVFEAIDKMKEVIIDQLKESAEIAEEIGKR